MLKLALLVILALPALAHDVTGNWQFTVETEQGSGSPSFVFKQDGEKLTGTYEGLFGKANIAGTVKGNDIDFTIPVEYENRKMTVHYRGRIESDTTMKGDVELPGLGKGTWTGAKK